jgi:hypothetical protein
MVLGLSGNYDGVGSRDTMLSQAGVALATMN